MRNKRMLLVVAVSLLVVSCGLLLPCCQQIRDGEAWSESTTNLHYIAQALHSYHEVDGRLPPAVITGKDGK